MGFLKPSQLSRLLGLLLSTTAPFATQAVAQNSGRVGAVNNDATGTPPGAATRKLTVGSGIVVKERVRTSSSGSTQIQFPDQSTLNIGSNSDMVIDQFVYDPHAKSGSMVASAAKGVLRYVGGQISHNSGATINTPSAAIGIRGGIVTIMLPLPPSIAASDPALAGLRGELVISHFGVITLSNGVSQVTLPPGFAAVIGGPNQPISTPFKLADATLQQIMQQLASKPGQRGGVANGPTSTQVPPGFSTSVLPNPPGPPGTDPLGYTSIFGAGNNAARNRSNSNQIQTTTPPSYP